MPNLSGLRHNLERVARVSRVAFTPVAIAALAYFAWTARVELKNLLVAANLGLLAAAVSIWIVLHTLGALATCTALRGLGAGIPYPVVLNVHVTRLPARYLPGGIWHTVARLVDFNRIGVARPVLVGLTSLELILPPAFTLTLGGFGLAVLPAFSRVSDAGAVCLVLGVLGLLMAPYLLQRVPGGHATSVHPGGYLKVLGILVVYWLTAALSFVLYLGALNYAPVRAAGFELATAYLSAYGIGYLAVFAPQGLGVFEAAMAYFMDRMAELPEFVTVIAGFRVVSLAGDILIWMIWLTNSRHTRISGP